MKRWFCWVAVLLLFAGCSTQPRELQQAMALRSEILSGNGCSFDTVITADYGDELHTFSLKCQGDRTGRLTFTVTEPETIAGITGTLDNQGGKLTFDDVVLQFDPMVDGLYSPVSAPWIFLNTLRSGYLKTAGRDGDQILVTAADSYEENALHVDIWLSTENTPVHGEILYENRRILTLELENFRIL